MTTCIVAFSSLATSAGRSDPSSSAGEPRYALCEERRDTLVQIVAVEDPLLRNRRQRQRRIERHVERSIDECLGQAVRQRTARGDDRGERTSARGDVVERAR